MFIQVPVVSIVKVDHDFAWAEYLAFTVDVKPVFDHAFEDGIDSVFIGVSGGLLEDAWEVVITSFDHVVHVIVELEFLFGFHFVFLLV